MYPKVPNYYQFLYTYNHLLTYKSLLYTFNDYRFNDYRFNDYMINFSILCKVVLNNSQNKITRISFDHKAADLITFKLMTDLDEEAQELLSYASKRWLHCNPKTKHKFKAFSNDLSFYLFYSQFSTISNLQADPQKKSCDDETLELISKDEFTCLTTKKMAKRMKNITSNPDFKQYLIIIEGLNNVEASAMIQMLQSIPIHKE